MSSSTVRPVSRPALLRAGLLACVCVLVAGPAAAGQLYQWTDANGVSHYSDSPPPHQSYQSRAIVNGGATVADAGAEATAKVAVNAQCSTAQANLKLLKNDAPVGVDSDQDGKPDSELTAEQRAAQTALAEAAIGVHCKPAVATAES